MLNSKAIISIIILNFALLSSGCAINRETVDIHPSSDLSNIKSVHVLRHDRDKRQIDLMIANKLKQMGYNASTGKKVSPGIEAIVTYKDKWAWDITLYMVELTVTIRDKKSNFPLARGNSFHTSLTRKSPQAMIDEVLSNLFDPVNNKPNRYNLNKK